jgi:hypothetical protein
MLSLSVWMEKFFGKYPLPLQIFLLKIGQKVKSSGLKTWQMISV